MERTFERQLGFRLTPRERQSWPPIESKAELIDRILHAESRLDLVHRLSNSDTCTWADPRAAINGMVTDE